MGTSAIPHEKRDGGIPTGTVTFAFTDIEGSTQRWDRDSVAMDRAVRRHDELVRAAIAVHGGHVFKTVGDGFCAAFARPEEALAAMLDMQRALIADDFSAVDGIRVRAAIHTGTTEERDGDYFGSAVNRVARLVAIAHGGQTIVSGVTADIVRGELPPPIVLRDLGEHRLRDLAQPEHVYQPVAPDLPAEFPPLRSLDVLPNNLPLQLRSFVGRDGEIAEIVALIERHRLLTLVGAGGVGKTRTSLQVAANLLDRYVDGVWFVELAPLSSGGYVASAISQALGLARSSDGDALENLVLALKVKRTLIVLDNCEHVVDAAARTVAAILRDCAHVEILASSRQALGVVGEATYRMPSLGVPSEAALAKLTAATSESYAAISLFGERARAVDNRFELTDENAPIVADICRRLDGIPLAIELAASRMKMFAPRQLRERLDERFRILTGGNRDLLPRQQTLRALIDWSYDLLDDRERVVFRRLGIFVNGFTLEGAVAVASGDDFDEFELIDVLGSLVDKSLVLAEPQTDELRYRLLESTRAYAMEKLDETNERASVARRHLRSLRTCFVERWDEKERTGRATGLIGFLAAELEDVRFALDGALARADDVDGGELLAHIGQYWTTLGLEDEGIARAEAYLAALPAEDSGLRARITHALSFLLSESGKKMRALEVATDAVALARASGDAATLGLTLRVYGSAAMDAGRLEDAETALAQAEAIPIGSAYHRIILLGRRANLSALRRDYDSAVSLNERLLEENRRLGNARGAASAAGNLAECEHARGRTQRAITIVREILPTDRSGSDRGMLATHLANLAGYLIAVDDLLEAAAAAREAVALRAAQDPDHAYVASGLEHIALICALGGDLERAARLEAYADVALRRHGLEREYTETATHDRLTGLLRAGLTPEHLRRSNAAGEALPPEAAIALALEEP
jgi:predicted ATPase/class 3 adenylate cyclase